MVANSLNGIAEPERDFAEDIVHEKAREGDGVPKGLSEWVGTVGHDFEGDGVAEEADSELANESKHGTS